LLHGSCSLRNGGRSLWSGSFCRPRRLRNIIRQRRINRPQKSTNRQQQRPEVADSGKTGNKNNPLLTEAPWPVHLAFFKVRPETPEPDYEMDMSLLPNGVVKTMKVDYGDFSVIGTLEEAQALRPVPCP